MRRELAARVDMNVLRWFGHVERMDNERLLKKVMNAKVILSLIFHSSFMQCYPLRFQLHVSCKKSVKYRFIFFVFDYGFLPYLLSLFFLVGSHFSFSCS